MVAQQRRFVGGLEQSAVAREWVSELLEGEGVASEDADAFRLAITEAATNVLRHAYEGRFPAAFDLHLEIDEQSVTVHLRDEGKPFHPGDVQAPNPEELHEGGYGLFLIETLMDEVTYQPGPGAGTVLRLHKRRQPRT
jgi:serine/threonine-protein kinase RsbW